MNAIEDDYRAVRETAGVADPSPRGLLEIRGKDRVRFMHGMTTNDVKALTPGAGQMSTMVTRQGKMVAAFKLTAFEDFFLMDMEPGLTRVVQESLSKLIITDDVQITAIDKAILALHGPQAPQILNRIFGHNFERLEPYRCVIQSFEGETLWISRHDPLGVTGYELAVSPSKTPALFERLTSSGAHRIGAEAMEVLRIENGTPRWGVDMDSTLLPMEAGLDDQAISYTKGCYLGQEVIQRVKTYSEPPQRLVGLLVERTAVPAHDDPILAGADTIGKITSAARSPGLNRVIALGYVRKEFKSPGTKVEIQSHSGMIPASVTTLPFLKPKGGNP